MQRDTISSWAVVTSRNAQMRGRAATLCDLRRRGPGRGVGKIVAVVTMLAQVALTICPHGKRKIARVGIAPRRGSRTEMWAQCPPYGFALCVSFPMISAKAPAKG